MLEFGGTNREAIGPASVAGRPESAGMHRDRSLKTERRIRLLIALWCLGACRVSIGYAQAPAGGDCSCTSVGFTPLSDLGTGFYQGQQGGLYPLGQNEDPPEHRAAGLALAQAIGPLDGSGARDPNGNYALLAVGMSNTAAEFTGFQSLGGADPDLDPHLVIVNGAQGGWDAASIVDPDATFWTTIDDRLSTAGVTPQQVVAAWVKEADAGPTLSFPDDAQKLQSELTTIAQILEQRYPNIQLAYFSSRIYAGYAVTPLNPEPFAYQSGFAVKWVIETQISSDPSLNFDPDRGPVHAPWMAWGPYLWADGLTPRSDGLTWACTDLGDDGTHPSPAGVEKVASMLLNFFKTDSTASPWFLARP